MCQTPETQGARQCCSSCTSVTTNWVAGRLGGNTRSDRIRRGSSGPHVVTLSKCQGPWAGAFSTSRKAPKQRPARSDVGRCYCPYVSKFSVGQSFLHSFSFSFIQCVRGDGHRTSNIEHLDYASLAPLSLSLSFSLSEEANQKSDLLSSSRAGNSPQPPGCRHPPSVAGA